ncbi:T9SS sorting signal type C domain-containing protein, partial [Flavobacterium sp.]|uniref:beta strand repeat-containing protein n=1 Tax=Flavobacterium sp. TaxID=239 RepID=UPI0025E1EC6B
TVNPNNTAGAASSTPTLCINTVLTNITRTTTSATGIGTATGLPAGVTATWATNTITISGTPTAAGTFNYSIPLTGGCGSVNATGSITVNPNNTAGTASSTPTLCINTVLTNITHSTTGATGIGTATGLPAGVTATWATNTITISGTPTAAGTFNYSIPLTGGCGSVNATGSITVNPNNTAGTASSTPTLCINTALTAITHATTSATGIGTATGLPAGVTASFATNTITISGTPTASGTFNYSIPLTGGCGSVNATGSITIRPLFTAGTIGNSGETICYNGLPTLGINSITAASGGDGVITYKWQANGVDIPGTNADTFNPPSGLTVTTTYTRFAKDTSCNATFTISSGSWVVTVSNTNTWTGTVSTLWTTAANWLCGYVPTIATDVVIGSASFYPVLASDVSINSLTLNSGTSMKVNATYDLNVTNAIINNGTLTLENDSNLVQTNNVSNTGMGSTIVKRNSSALKRLDYTLWSSPVTGQGVYAFSPFTLPTRFYTYNTATNFYNSVAFNLTGLQYPSPLVAPNGVNGTDSNNVQFAKGKGYLIRMPWDHPTTATVWNGTFTGVPNNGNISFAMTTGYNAVGNPYPSRINVKDFIDGNTSISGPLYLWRKTNDNAATSYATVTKTAYVANGATGGDTGTGYFNTGNEANWVLNIGQGFIVNATSSSNLTFTNSMRRSSNAGQFFRAQLATVTSVDSGLYWLNLNTDAGIYSQMAVGYSSEGTLAEDRGIDGKNINNEFYLTSLIGTDEYSIQGRPDFQDTDIVPLSYKIATAGNYSISIDHTAGLFSGNTQAIYLKDNLTSTYTNLNSGVYAFTSSAGTFNNRFEIVYQSQLANPNFTSNTVVIYNQNNGFVVDSGNFIMSSIKVFDVRGRLIETKSNINANQATINGGFANEVLLVQITTEDGFVVTKKVLR